VLQGNSNQEVFMLQISSSYQAHPQGEPNPPAVEVTAADNVVDSLLQAARAKGAVNPLIGEDGDGKFFVVDADSGKVWNIKVSRRWL
jgi:hypothetical protein